MKEHIILEKAKRYNQSNKPVISNECAYDSQRGFWIDNTSNTAMMKNDSCPKPTSKKCDVETGEDQKGE